MNKKVIGMSAVAVIIIGAVLLLAFGMPKKSSDVNNIEVTKNSKVVDEKNATYQINGMSVALHDGVSEMEAAPGSASKIITKYFGNEVRHDFNGDGREDVAFLLTQQTGGSGTFYYAVVALDMGILFAGSDAFLLGDRIAPQSTVMGKGNVFIVNYADRNPNEPFSAQPSVGKSVWLLLDPKTMKLGQVAQNFEGEASPSVMKLDMKKWNWVNTTYKGGTTVTPRDPARFTLTFNKNSFSAATDCNGVGGEYSVNGSNISFTKMMSTMMFCEGSQEGDYTKMLGNVATYHFTSKGELVFDLAQGAGSMTYK